MPSEGVEFGVKPPEEPRIPTPEPTTPKLESRSGTRSITSTQGNPKLPGSIAADTVSNRTPEETGKSSPSPEAQKRSLQDLRERIRLLDEKMEKLGEKAKEYTFDAARLDEEAAKIDELAKNKKSTAESKRDAAFTINQKAMKTIWGVSTVSSDKKLELTQQADKLREEATQLEAEAAQLEERAANLRKLAKQKKEDANKLEKEARAIAKDLSAEKKPQILQSTVSTMRECIDGGKIQDLYKLITSRKDYINKNLDSIKELLGEDHSEKLDLLLSYIRKGEIGTMDPREFIAIETVIKSYKEDKTCDFEFLMYSPKSPLKETGGKAGQYSSRDIVLIHAIVHGYKLIESFLPDDEKIKDHFLSEGVFKQAQMEERQRIGGANGVKIRGEGVETRGDESLVLVNNPLKLKFGELLLRNFELKPEDLKKIVEARKSDFDGFTSASSEARYPNLIKFIDDKIKQKPTT